MASRRRVGKAKTATKPVGGRHAERKNGSPVWRLPSDLVAPWLTAHGLVVDQIGSGAPIWRTADGLIPLEPEDVETLVALADPVAWGYLNLVEVRPVFDLDRNEVAIEKGSPWRLFPIQQKIVRFPGNLIVEAGAEVGKTRAILLEHLHAVSTRNEKTFIACASEAVATEIATAIEEQLDLNPTIGGGLKTRPRRSPFIEFDFVGDDPAGIGGGNTQLRIVGTKGAQLRGMHAGVCSGDEVALWPSMQVFAEFFSRGTSGTAPARFKLYSTPNGDRSSPFYSLCARAKAIDGRDEALDEKLAAVSGTPAFAKIRVAKSDLPPPMWGEKAAERAAEIYGGRGSNGWIQNVEGGWGEPLLSVFPQSLIGPCLARSARFRAVFVEVEPENARATLKAARLSDVEDEGERIVANEDVPIASDRDVADAIARFFPETTEAEELYCGADLGSAKDPTEVVVARREGARWSDLFRLHLEKASWESQTAIFVALDCASHHRVKFGIDAGAAGAFLVSRLIGADLEVCPLCRRDSNMKDRVTPFNFGAVVDAIDVETGEPLTGEKKDADGRPVALRLSNKEFSTRLLEGKFQKRLIAVADDGGCGNSRQSSSALLRSVSQIGVTSRGERRFADRDDHHADARRQVALAIAKDARDGFAGGGWVPADPKNVVTLGARSFSGVGELIEGAFRSGKGGVEPLRQAPAGPTAEERAQASIVGGSVRSSFGSDW